MSHLTHVKSKLNNLDSLKKALTKLGYQYKEGDLKTEGYYGQRDSVDVRVESINGKDIKGSFGFKQEADGNIKITGDFYGLKSPTGKALSAQFLSEELFVHSKMIEAEDGLKSIGFQANGDWVMGTDGSAELVFQKWE